MEFPQHAAVVNAFIIPILQRRKQAQRAKAVEKAREGDSEGGRQETGEVGRRELSVQRGEYM